MASKNEKFWMYDVTQLFRSYELLPSPEDSLSAKLNTITRLALIVCIVIAAYKPVLAFSTLILVMVITMSVYSGAVADPTIEGFEPGPVDGIKRATNLYGGSNGLTVLHDAPNAYGAGAQRNPSTGCGSNQQLYEFMREYNSTRYPDLNKVGFSTTQKRFCNDAVPLEYGPDHVSPNQELVGGPNPKTKVSPLVAAPSHDLDSWRNNDFVVHSQINKETNFDAEKSGYNCGILPTKCEDCMYVPCQCKVLQGQRRGMMNSAGPNDGQSLDQPLPEVTLNEEEMVDVNGDVVEGFREDNGHIGARRSQSTIGPQGGAYGGRRAGGHTRTRTVINSRRGEGRGTNRPSRAGRPGGPGGRPGGGPGGRPGMDREQRRQIIRDLINKLGDNEPKKHKPYIRRYVKDVFLDRRLGDVNDVEIDEIIEEIAARFVMTPRQEEESEAPDIAPCFESPRRDNIITQTLQPGVFQKSHIGEPIQSNIGISYTQEWGPTEVQETNNMIKYTMRDPKNTIITPQIKEEVIGQDHANVYDPRFTGYGTSYRSYTDQLTGRPKFFYDDVDAITMPNYVTRSKVDVFPWANTYGPDKMMSQDGFTAGRASLGSEGDEYRQLANNAFTDSALTFRTELQERLMRKRNAELWQRRVAPISTMGRLGSSMKSC